MFDARTGTVQSIASTEIAGPNPRRVRIEISSPLTNPIQVELNGAATATTGWPLVVGGFPLVLGDGEYPGNFTQSIQAIALGGSATVYVVDEFLPSDNMP